MTADRSGRAHPARLPLTLLLAGLALLLGACKSNTNAYPGTPVITMSATNSGFSSYTVAIDEITLTREDNTVVTPLFTPETVDLVSLANFPELVGAPAVPAGNYVSATVVLDYGAASIWINVNGHPIPATSYAADGTILTGQQVLTVTFDKNHPLVVTNPQSTRLAINFDLAAFNTITSTNAFTVRPFVTVSPVTVDYHPLRVRGIFVVTQSDNFVMNIRPFYDLSSALGGIQVNVGDQTYYNVNQQAYTGAPGLAAIHTLAISQPIAAYGSLGSLATITPQFNATQVYAGPSQESLAQDHIIGTIAARSGGTLTIRGAALHSGFGIASYADNSSVIVDATTIVSADGQILAGLSQQSLSVGQWIDAAGVSAVDADGNVTLDTRDGGQVRMLTTPAWGTVTAANAGSATLDLTTLGGFQVPAFDFAGTGSGGIEVDPHNYIVTSGTATSNGSQVLAEGLVAPFGAGPPDFNALSLTDAKDNPQQQLVVEWQNGGTAAPFSSQSAAGLVVDLGNPNLSIFHYIASGPYSVDLGSLAGGSPLITTTGANQQALTLAIGNSTLTTGVSIYNSAAAFSTALGATLNGTNKVYRLVAVGQYNQMTNTFVAQNISVALEQ